MRYTNRRILYFTHHDAVYRDVPQTLAYLSKTQDNVRRRAALHGTAHGSYIYG